jgi:mono/diheme cytochrome c family protein
MPYQSNKLFRQKFSYQRLCFFSLVSVISLMLNGCGGDGETMSIADSYTSDDAAVQRGRLIFAGTCAGYCHKLSSERSDAPYLFDCEWIHGGRDEQIYTSIAEGISGTRMLAFGENFPEGAEDLWKVIAYLKVNRQSCS